MKKMSKAHRKMRAKLPVWQRRALAQRDFIDEKLSTWYGRLQLGVMVLLALVITKRVKVANMLYVMSDSELLTAGQRYVQYVNTASATFTTPNPALSLTSTILSDFSTLIGLAASHEKEQVALKNAKREQLMNVLTVFGAYVEEIANDPVNVEVGALAIIDSAGMRARPFTPRGKQIWEVMRGRLSGTLFLTAVSVKGGSHEWQYTSTPTVDSSWITATPTKRAHTTISGLAQGSFVYCRHRSVSSHEVTDWEGHDPVVIG